MEEFGTLDISETTIDFLVVRWRQAAKQEGDRIKQTNRKNGNEA